MSHTQNIWGPGQGGGPEHSHTQSLGSTVSPTVLQPLPHAVPLTDSHQVWDKENWEPSYGDPLPLRWVGKDEGRADSGTSQGPQNPSRVIPEHRVRS